LECLSNCEFATQITSFFTVDSELTNHTTLVRRRIKKLRLTFLRQLNIFHGALYHLDDVRYAVGTRELPRVLRHISRLDSVHLPGPGLRAPDGKDAAPGTHVKDYLTVTDPPNSSNQTPELLEKNRNFKGFQGSPHLSLEVGSVAEDGGVVGIHADAVA